MKRSLIMFAVLVTLTACADDVPSLGGTPTPASTSSPTPQSSPTVDPTPSPPVAGTAAFAVIGDWGTGTEPQHEVADRMCRWRQRRTFDHVFTTGDNIYPDGSRSNFEPYFFDVYGCLFDAGVRWHAALGNHDVALENGGAELDEPAFGLKARNYVVRKFGVRFVVIDSNAVKMRFVRKQTRAQPGDRFTVVVMHHPVFSGGDSHGPTPGSAERFAGLFSRRGVDLVLSGHDHVYSRSKIVAGVRYVVTGGGGAALNGCRSSVAIVSCAARHHFLYVEVLDNRLKVQAVPRWGKPFDAFTVRT
jgi:hypothetical protein